jgi:hypothetical protein
MKAETRVMPLQAKEHQRLPANYQMPKDEEAWKVPSVIVLRRNQPGDNLISNFQSPELKKIILCCL